MSAIIVCLAPVRRAVEQSARLGMPETQRQVVARQLADIRDGHHAYAPAISALERVQRCGEAPRTGGAA